jgi:hypothetical protein
MRDSGYKVKGKELIKLIAEMRAHDPEMRPSEMAVMAGYYRIDQNGNRAGDPLALLDALIQAKIENQRMKPKVGAKPKFELFVQKDGKIIIGSAYTTAAGLHPGVRMQVAILEHGKILLKPKKGK